MDCKTCLRELHQRSWKDIQETPKELKEHLEQCPSCFDEFQWSNHTREAFFELEKTEIPVNLHHTIMSALESERPVRRKIEVNSWFSYLQFKPTLSFAAASVLVIALATMHLTRPEPVQTMELLQPNEPETSMRTLTKEEPVPAPAPDSVNMMLVPPSDAAGEEFLDISLEINAEEFSLWQEFLNAKEFPHQFIELETENQLVIEGTGSILVELYLGLKNDLKLQDTSVLPEFIVEEDLAFGKRKEEQIVAMKSQQSYRVTFVLKEK